MIKKVIHSKISLIKPIFWSIISIVLTLPIITKSAGSGTTGGNATIDNPLGTTSTFADLISKIASIVLKIGFPIAVIFIIYSGFLFVTARGSEEKIKTAKKTFTWSIIGTAVLLGAEILALAIKATIESF
ncbi:pilin [Patescibacteria group bacterium]|nr:pilin [Patescibacteria group bacterium]